LEYGVNYLSAGNTPFAPCTDPADAASAASLVASGANATQLPCAMTAYDEGDDEDVTGFIGITQVIVGAETFYSLSQHGTGVIPPGQYVYEYSVTDLDGNEAKETFVINVALRKYYEWNDIEVDTSVWELDGFQDAFRTYQAENLKEVFETSFPNFIIRGADDLEILSFTSDAATGKTTFKYKLTYFELPDGFDASGTTAATATAARRRRLLSSDLGSSVSSSLDASLSNSSGTNVTTNASSTTGTESPDVDYDAAVLASIQGEISVIAQRMDTATTELQETVDAIALAGGNPAAFKRRLGDYWKTLLEIGDASLKELQSQAEETLQVLDATITVQQQVLESVAELEILLKQQADALKATINALGAGEDGLGQACEYRTGLGTAEIFFNSTAYSQFGSPPPNPAPPPSPPSPPPCAAFAAPAVASAPRGAGSWMRTNRAMTPRISPRTLCSPPPQRRCSRRARASRRRRRTSLLRAAGAVRCCRPPAARAARATSARRRPSRTGTGTASSRAVPPRSTPRPARTSAAGTSGTPTA
jgi:hypothetical protein